MNDGLTQDDLNEDCPILMQKDFQTTIQNIADLPDYLRKINENIINIDKRISKKELNTDKVKQLNTHYSSIRENTSKCSNDLFELNNIVKQSINGLNDILGVKKDPIIIEAIEEENINREDLIYHPKLKHTNKDTQKSHNTPPIDNRKRIKKPIHHAKTAKNKGDNLIQINKPTNNQSSSQSVNGVKRQKKNNKNNKKNESNDRLLNNTSITFVHLTNEQSLKNITNSRGLASSNDIINNNEDNIGIATCAHSKEKKNSHNNNFSFKPKIKKDSINTVLNEVSISSELQNKVLAGGILQKANTIQSNQLKSKSKGSYSLHQRLLTEQNKSSLNRNTLSTLKTQDKITIERNNQPKQVYSKNDHQKGATTQDILRLMLFFNEYIMSTNTIKSSSKNKRVLETISISLSKALKSTDNDTDAKYNPNTELSSMERGDCTNRNEKVINSVLKLQKKWRSYKVKDIILKSSQHDANEKSLIKSMIVNNFIEKEGFCAKKLIGMINSSIESFLLLQSNIALYNCM